MFNCLIKVLKKFFLQKINGSSEKIINHMYIFYNLFWKKKNRKFFDYFVDYSFIIYILS